MTEPEFIAEKDSAIFVCPECESRRNAIETHLQPLDHLIELKCTCPCGSIYSTTLERHQSFRKEVFLKGIYEYAAQEEQGTITVENLSIDGLKFKLGVRGGFCAGRRLWVEFQLDNSQQTVIRRQVEVRWMKGLTVGANFVNPNQYDGLGLYVLS